jgi:hypothetical protein
VNAVTMAVTIGQYKISLSAVIPIVLHAGFYYKKFGDFKDRGIISTVLTAASVKISA